MPHPQGSRGAAGGPFNNAGWPTRGVMGSPFGEGGVAH